MSYYTERHGMRKPSSRTYRITPQMYGLLLKCCEKYFNNIAWKYPEQCPDGHECCGLDQGQFDSHLKYEIPSLFRDKFGHVAVPLTYSNIFENEERCDEYDQYSLLDYIEFFAQNCKDVDIKSYHNYFKHNHLSCKDTNHIFKQFQNEINGIFKKTGLLYELTDNQIIERVIEYTPLTSVIEQEIEKIKENGTRELLTEAITLFRQPNHRSARDAVEKYGMHWND